MAIQSWKRQSESEHRQAWLRQSRSSPNWTRGRIVRQCWAFVTASYKLLSYQHWSRSIADWPDLVGTVTVAVGKSFHMRRIRFLQGTAPSQQFASEVGCALLCLSSKCRAVSGILGDQRSYHICQLGTNSRKMRDQTMRMVDLHAVLRHLFRSASLRVRRS